MKHILIIRLSAMGDVAMTSPVVAALRKANPELRITVLTRPLFRVFYRDIQGVEFVDFDPNGRHKGLRGLMRLWGDILKNACPDYVADLHDVLRTKILRNLFRINGIKVAVINKGRVEKKQLTRAVNKIREQLTPTVDRYADVFRGLGFSLDVSDNLERKKCAIPEQFGEKCGVWIGIAPFAQHEGKIYPPEQMQRVVEILSQRQDVKLFIFGGGDNERRYAEKLEKSFPNVISVIGKAKLAQELDLISNLDLMVNMDSSAMHMASLQGVQSVSIWGATHPYAGFLGVGQSVNDVISADMECSPCSVYGNKPCARGDYACMNTITPERIVEKILSKIKRDENNS